MDITKVNVRAHKHCFDIHPNPEYTTLAACTICGFAVPTNMFRMVSSLDAWTARQNATERLLASLHIDRNGQEVESKVTA